MLAAELASRPPAVPGPIYVAGFFNHTHGIAESARRCADALEHLGYDVQRLTIGEPSGDAYLTPAGDPGPETGTVIIHANAPEFVYALRAIGINGASRCRIIGYWAWELPEAPPDWLARTKLCDELWVPSRYVADAFGEAECPVIRVPHPFRFTAKSERDIDRKTAPFHVLAMGDLKSSLDRKNLVGAVEAFRLAFPNDDAAILTIKTQNADADPVAFERLSNAIGEDQRIRLFDRQLERNDVIKLIVESDCYLSMHRAEGFGLVLAEAMQLGTPVVATRWSGNLDFMDDASACLVSCKLVPVSDNQEIYRSQSWADPDLHEAAGHIKRLASDPDYGVRTVERAREMVEQELGFERYLSIVQPRLGSAQPPVSSDPAA